ncbi:MAG: MBL fold metallo-hydrolase, partial [Sulfurovaceae bacterium]|nr:MBL fold metallo-hydrolase [Sulfurovaceae bacterium]
METVNSVKTEVKKSSTNSAVTDIKKIANEKPKEEITKTEPKVEKKVENKSKAKVEIIQKIDSIGEKKTVGEIITAAISQIKDLAENKDNKTKSKATDAFDYKLKPKKVADNVWCFFGALEPPTKKNAGNMANNCYIKTKDSYVLMDTGPSYQFALQAYNAMKKIADLPVSHIIISHEHDDHWLGNDFYKKKFNAKIIGPASINRDYKDGVPTRMFNILPKNAIEGTHIIKVDESPKEKTSIVVGGEKFDIIPMDTKAHTGDDIFLY